MQASTRAAEGGRETELPSSVQNYKETVHKFYLMTYQRDFFNTEDIVYFTFPQDLQWRKGLSTLLFKICVESITVSIKFADFQKMKQARHLN